MKPVIITWNDTADHDSSWVDVADVDKWSEKSCTITSIGFLIKSTSKYHTIVGDWDADNTNFGRVTKIPVACVVSIEELCSEPSSP